MFDTRRKNWGKIRSICRSKIQEQKTSFSVNRHSDPLLICVVINHLTISNTEHIKQVLFHREA